MEKDIKRKHFAEGVVLAQIPWGAVVKVTGEDAADFLQGQFSQELRDGKAGRVSYGFWLSRTGKVEGDAWVVREGDNGFTLLSRSMSAVQLIARLEHHIIADDVELSDETGSFSAWWIAGGGAEAFLARVDSGETSMSGEGWGLRDPIPIGESSGYWVGAEPPDWGEGVELVDEAQIETRRIVAGVPRVPIDVGPNDIPQEGRLAQVGVSFNKGCYLGQEVVARVQNTGRVRRRLISITGAGAPPSGEDEVIMLGDRAVGTLRSRVRQDQTEWSGIAMVSEAVERGSEAALTLASDGSALRWHEIGVPA